MYEKYENDNLMLATTCDASSQQFWGCTLLNSQNLSGKKEVSLKSLFREQPDKFPSVKSNQGNSSSCTVLLPEVKS